MVYVGGFFFFKQKTAYEMRISDWSSDVCSSDLPVRKYRAVISSAISIHQNPNPHRVIPATSPKPAATSPKPGRPLAAKISGASPPSNNMPRADRKSVV